MVYYEFDLLMYITGCMIKSDCVRIYIFNNAKFFEKNLCISKTQLQKGKNVGYPFSKCSNTFNLNKGFLFCM